MSKFREAMGASINCFVNPQQYEREPFGIDDARIVPALDFPIARNLCYVRPSQLRDLEEELESVPLLSVHAFYRYHCLWARDFSVRKKIPYWHVPHGILDPYVMSYGAISKRLFLGVGGTKFIKDAACTIFATRREWEKAESVFGILQGEVLPWPVDSLDMSNRDRIRSEVRFRLGIPDSDRVLIYFGRVQTMKRPLETIEAVAQVKSDTLHLIMVGPSEGISEIECLKSAQRAGLKNFHFIGPVFGEEKFNYLFASDAYISMSIRENFNHTAAEALSVGTPVLLSTGNDLSGELAEVGCCWKIENDAIHSAVKQIQDFCDLDSSVLQEMGLRGHQWVEEYLNYDLFKSRLGSLLKKYAKK